MKRVSARELKKWRDRRHDFLLINVQPHDAYLEGHIPRSLNVPAEQHDFVSHVKTSTGNRKDTRIVLYGNDAADVQRLATAARKLDQAGFAHVYLLPGGLVEWQRKGLPLESLATA